MKTVFICLAIQRVFCTACGLVRQVDIKFADSRRRYTRAFERYVLSLSRHMTIKDVADHLAVNWDVVKDIQKRHLVRRYRKPKLKHLKRIAIDEISIGKGHQYLTVVLDLDTGVVVFVGDGKGPEALLPFRKRLKAARAKVHAMAIDMSPACIKAIVEHLPKAKIVFDHFHIIKLFNEKLTEIRRKLYHQVSTTMEKNILKATRWLLLKNPENPDEARNETQRLNRALEINRPLATAYYMKEELRLLWLQKNKQAAEAFLKDLGLQSQGF